jgi:uncharacterized protein (TIGR03435 family)
MRGIIAGLMTFTCGAAFGQTPVSDAQAVFEVASVRMSAMQEFNPNAMGSGALTTVGLAQIRYIGRTLKSILFDAYQVQSFQISGPAWLDTQRYDIIAKVPQGAGKAAYYSMLRNLLAERFHLTLHHETREIAVYELVIGKSGLRMKDADRNVPPPPEPGAPPARVGVPDKDGFPQLPPGYPFMIGGARDGRMRWTGRMQSIAQLAAFLGGPPLRRPVVDRTTLTGTYDFTLEYAADTGSEGGLSVIGAVQEQLGLTLESAKARFDVLVIDRVDRAPTEN